MSLDVRGAQEALSQSGPSDSDGVSRRRFLGYLIAAPTLVAAADLRAAVPADASIPTFSRSMPST